MSTIRKTTLKSGDLLVIIVAKVEWAIVHTPHEGYKGVDFENKINVIIDPATFAKLTALKFHQKMYVSKRDPNNLYVSFKKKTKDPKKSSIVVVDKHGKKLEDSIGDGSLCEVAVMLNFFGNNKSKSELFAVKVLELVPYVAPEKSEEQLLEKNQEALDIFNNASEAEDVI